MNFSGSLFINLGGESALIKNKDQILSSICRAAAAIGLEAVDLSMEIDMIRGFENLKQFILDHNGLWVCNDTLLLHVFPNGFPHPYVQISRDYEWACAAPADNCIGVHTQSMLESPQGPIELVASLMGKPISLLDGFRSIHIVNEFSPDDNETACRNAMATLSWGRLALLDIHYKFVFFQQDSLPYVWDIFEQLDEFAQDGDLCIFTNRDICLVPEATAIIRSFMTNHGLKTAYASRIDVLSFDVASHHDLFGAKQYQGVDLFCWIKGNLPKVSAPHKQLIIGRESWDSVFYRLFGGSKHKIPYNICYHYSHEPAWQSDSGAKGNWHNKLLCSMVNQDMKIKLHNKEILYYEPDRF